MHVVVGEFLRRQAALMARAPSRRWANVLRRGLSRRRGMDATGISNSHESVAAFQQAVLRHAKRVYFCLDASKLGRATPHRVAGWFPLSP